MTNPAFDWRTAADDLGTHLRLKPSVEAGSGPVRQGLLIENWWVSHWLSAPCRRLQEEGQRG
jgi:hypothetical protein